MTANNRRIRQICNSISAGDDDSLVAVIEQIRSAVPPLTSDEASTILDRFLAGCDPNNTRYSLFKQLVRETTKRGAEFDKRRYKLQIVDHHLRRLTSDRRDAVRCWKLIIKQLTKSSLLSRKRWINKLSKLAYGGSYRVACELLRSGKSSDFELTPDEATNILNCCGPDIRYSFCKRLLRCGAKFSDDIVKQSSAFLEYWTNAATTAANGSSDSADNSAADNSAAADFKQDSLAGWKLVSKFTRRLGERTTAT